MNTKANRLIELVQGKITLSEAPTRRDLILDLYNFDIDDESNRREQTDIPGECPAYEKYIVIRKFAALVRSVRNREKKGDDTLHSHNNYQYYMIQDESKVWRCVHIIHELNGHYLLKQSKALEKEIETSKQNIQTMTARANMSEELRRDMRANEIKSRWKRLLVKQHCTPKHIRSYIKELRNEGKLLQDYKPNIRGIQYVFEENGSEIQYVVYNHHDWLNGRSTQSGRMTYKNHDELVKNMTKDIILCDYLKQDCVRPEPVKADYLGIMK